MPVAGQQRVLQFIESQAAHIESRVRMIEHGDIQYPELVGISREASPYADSIVYYSWDGSGRMADIANAATDFPFLDITENQHSVGIHWKGLAYGWTIREAGRAMQLGMPLQDRKVKQAFRIAEEEKERVFLYGDQRKGWDGIVNQTTRDAGVAYSEATRVVRQTVGTAWATESPENIFNQINAMLSGVWVDSNQVRIANTLLLPVDQFARLQRPMGDNADKSIMDYVKQFNIYTAQTNNELMIRTVRQLSNAGTAPGGGNTSTARAIAYTRDMNVLRYHIPQELQFMEPQLLGISYNYYGTLVLGGLEIMEPTAVRYLDGV